MRLKGDRYLDAVGDLDEGNAAVHPVVLAVKGHCPFNAAFACAFAGKYKVQRLGFGHTANSEGPLNIKGGGTGLHNLGGVKRDVRINLESKKSLLFNLSSFMPLPVFTESA